VTGLGIQQAWSECYQNYLLWHSEYCCC
jgi:hypothetical protein